MKVNYSVLVIISALCCFMAVPAEAQTGSQPKEPDYHTYVDNIEKKLSTVQGPQKFLGSVTVGCLLIQTVRSQSPKLSNLLRCHK